MNELQPGERIDELNRNHLRIIQNDTLPKFGLEGVLLANFPRVQNGWKVCDLCSGSGIVPLLLTTRASDLKITAIEVEPKLSEMSERSVRLNSLSETIQIKTEDLRQCMLPADNWDLVTANPPYFKASAGVISADVHRATARSNLTGGIVDVVTAASRLLRHKGFLALVYRASGLSEALAAVAMYKLGVTRLRFVHHNEKKEASVVLLECQKGVADRIRVERPLLLYRVGGEMNPEMQAVYYEGRGLESRSK
ncbi:MAG TPA: methyltransferase [Desulfobacteria bacterium]|nr:methyltransferase [Desulfobacteria bacterium]